MLERNCGECNACCTIAEVVGVNFYKEPYTPCQFLTKGCNGCNIYENRPQACKNYECAWIRGFGDINDSPDKSNVMIYISNFNGGIWIFVIETEKGAYLTTGKNIILDIANKFNYPVIVVDYDSTYPNDKGDYVIIKNDLQSRSKNIKGEHICEYDNNMNVYKLIIN